MVDSASRHPEPPTNLDEWTLPLVEIPPPYFRCHSASRGPLYFNRGRIGRFNAPNGEYGVLYLGRDEYCAFIETFGQSMRRNERGISLISVSDLARSCLCRIGVTPNRGPLRLVDLAGAGLSRLGADGRLNTMTDDRGVPQRWALALHQHPERPDGLYYRVRHDLSRTGIALFDRIGDVLDADCRDNALARADALAGILAHYRFALSPTDDVPER